MRGSLKKRYKDSWTIRIDVGRDPVTGKRRQKRFTVRGTKPQAEKRMRELLAMYDGGIGSDAITVAAYLRKWYDEHQVKLSPRGRDRYGDIIEKHLIPELGHLKLSRLTPDDIQGHYNRALESLSAATVRYHHAVLHNALKSAVTRHLIVGNPTEGTTLPPKGHTVIMQVWDAVQVTQFLTAAERTSHYALFYTALHTGMRRSELLGLRWQDISGNTLSVSRGLVQTKDNNYHYTGTKRSSSRRTIALTSSNAVVLRKHKESMTALALLNGYALKPDTLIFCHGDGSPLRPNSITRSWDTLVKRTGLPVIRLHDARHTHATLLLKAGVHAKIVQERLGHASIQMTLDLYSHVTPGMQDAAAEIFDKEIGSP